MFSIAVHGGAGTWDPADFDAARDGLLRAVSAARDVLASNGSALDAVVAAAVVLEDDPTFNAGTGGALSLAGEVECDAAVMEGDGLRAGAVAAVRGVKNPILLARRVMEETDHLLLAGAGAEALAEAWGLRTGNDPTPVRRARWQKARDAIPADAREGGPKLAALLKAHPELGATRRGTIGAVARDARGGVAVATSTGGVVLKLAGRIGDTPILGAGTYATPGGAASATGKGELMMRALTTQRACAAMERGEPASAAAATALAETSRLAGDDLGLITVDRDGRFGIAHATPWMPHATWRDGGAVMVSMRV